MTIDSVTITFNNGQTHTVTKAVTPPPFDVYQLLGDENLAQFNYEGRTAQQDNFVGKCTPSVMRFEKTARPPSSDYRVDISPLNSAIRALNNNNEKAINYLYSSTTALYNGTGYPKQAYITMQGNKLKAIAVDGSYLKFETLTPSSNVAGMSYATHPHFVHRFDLVCFDKSRTPKTYHKPNTPQGVIFYYMVTKEGYGYIPLAWVRKL